MTPFRRDGHLSDLGLELLEAGEIGREVVQEHLDGCATCRARWQALADDDVLPLPARPTPRPANRPNPGWLGLGALVALAAAVVLVVLLRPRPDTFRPRGGDGIGLEVWVERDGRSVPLVGGESVVPGERLGFRIIDPRGGHLLVAGRDATGAWYPCWPPDGRSRELGPSVDPRQLDAAVAFDDVPGDEELVALRCVRPIALTSLPPSGQPPEGCVQSVVRLHKEAP
ncbi:MAG: hypothetical protein H6738_18960 [Alphaproteobacteria bacterium]|nr:hypothetical protein [Alphaproteobacteria bacterium]MCB9698869.1 hypothetical protein [Alphaproteobacteria bacterium]